VKIFITVPCLYFVNNYFKIMRTNFIIFLFAFILASCSDAPANTEDQTSATQSTGQAVETSVSTVIDEPANADVVNDAQPEESATAAPAPVRQLSQKEEAPVSSPSASTENAAPKSEEPSTSGTAIPKIEKAVPEVNEPVAAPKTAPSSQKSAPASPPNHEAWDKLLRQYVSAAGKVNYAGLKKDGAKLDAYLKMLSENSPQASWSRGEKMAFWINAYNANTVKLIVDNYPVSSITKLHGGNPWKVEWVKIGGKTYSLDFIENGILRPQFKDARIHFAVNCAAKSCPPLLNRAWTASTLESNFQSRAKAFINNPAFNKIGAKEVQVSKIFEWYAADFGNLISFLNKYSATQIKPNTTVKYLEYNWALNE